MNASQWLLLCMMMVSLSALQVYCVFRVHALIRRDLRALSREMVPEKLSYAEWNGLCPHGEEHAECNACMVQSDLAYDAARESRASQF